MITNSSSVIYSYADSAEFARLCEILGDNYDFIIIPELEYILENYEPDSEELAPYIGNYFQYKVSRVYSWPKETEETSQFFTNNEGGTYRYLRTDYETLAEEFGIKVSELPDKFPKFYCWSLEETNWDECIESIGFERAKELGDKLFELEQENWNGFAPSNRIALFKDGKYDYELTRTIRGLFDYEATYDG